MIETIGTLLANGTQQLATQCGEKTAFIEARVLLRHIVDDADDATLIRKENNEVTATVREAFEHNVQRRLTGEPVAYIVGNCEFMGLDFITTPAALVPRPETEEMTEAALLHLPEDTGRVLDMGAGCGAIGLSIAHLKKQIHVLLADTSEDTLALAQKNAHHLGVNNAQFHHGNWFSQMGNERFDLIVSNPPYVAANDEVLATLRYEPILALVGGNDGLDGLRQVIVGAPQHLTAGGVLMVEHGAQQATAVRMLFASAGFCGVCCCNDLAGLPRITFAVRGGGHIL
ncbi:peptide chain release factor N(5)-glutamine methyltransferase [Candidatus Persebacteraceae bacterium Df01]|jgi:release factor glutamine methyltransferase|uniref:peptide chain release factor N(5)-glutamine methyltransferase n=1 Tax=Candidatus Doriopsillibacter californiensis TaxID=2970740 RepID=A0ABT7QLD2_9GAMM|nr:peptide chain release factor N(5)-glutamine methyltransferase [Candidatus Persebacteraceae bacterium Df01]